MPHCGVSGRTIQGENPKAGSEQKEAKETKGKAEEVFTEGRKGHKGLLCWPSFGKAPAAPEPPSRKNGGCHRERLSSVAHPMKSAASPVRKAHLCVLRVLLLIAFFLSLCFLRFLLFRSCPGVLPLNRPPGNSTMRHGSSRPCSKSRRDRACRNQSHGRPPQRQFQ